MIKNLNQLKRRLRPGTRLEVTGHCRPGCIGQLREVTWVNTQGVYTKILNPPDPRINPAAFEKAGETFTFRLPVPHL